MENVFVGVRHATFDAQVAIRVGAFALYCKGMNIVLLHGDTAVETVAGVVFNIYCVEFDVHIVEKAEVAQCPIGVCYAALVIWKVFQNLDGTQKRLRLYLGFIVIVEI